MAFKLNLDTILKGIGIVGGLLTDKNYDLNGILSTLGSNNSFSNVSFGNLLFNLASGYVLNNIDLGTTPSDSPYNPTGSNFNPNSFLDELNLDLGDLFDSLTGTSLFDGIDLEGVFGDLGGLSIGDFSLDDLLGDLGDIFEGLDLSDLFGGLEDDYYYIFNPGPLDNLLTGLSSIQFNDPTLSNQQLSDVDLLDGLGVFLNALGESDLLGTLAVTQFRQGGAVNDRIRGLDSNDLLLGLASDDRLLGQRGNDLLNGGEGDDRLKGVFGNDILTGMAGDDRLVGDKGKDILFGGAGFDSLVGGKGGDVFVIGAELGVDVIYDFKNRQDRLALLDNVRFKDLDFIQEDRDLVIGWRDDEIAVLKNVKQSEISISDFVTIASDGLF